MAQTVKVTICRRPTGIVVRNDRGMTWEFRTTSNKSDFSTQVTVGTIATSMLTATISEVYARADERGTDVEFELAYSSIDRR